MYTTGIIFSVAETRSSTRTPRPFLDLPVRNPEFPQASMILSAKERPRKTFPFSILSSIPKKMEVTPTVPMPTFRVVCGGGTGGEGGEKSMVVTMRRKRRRPNQYR